VVLMIAGLFVVGGAIFETGIADAAGRWLGRIAGVQPVRLLVVVMVSTALLSAFLSSTGTVAVMLPVVLSLVRRAGLSPSKVMMPLAFASLLGGMLTLIGTPPNLVVSNQLRAEGLEPFNFFAFTPVGVAVLAVGVLFMVTLGRHLLPDRRPPSAEEGPSVTRAQLMDGYALRDQLFELQLLPTSESVGRTLAETGLRRHYQIDVLTLATPTSRGRHLRLADPGSLLRVGDVLLVKGERRAVERFASQQDVVITDWQASLPDALQLAEVLVPPRSRLLGRSVREVRFRDRYGVAVLADKRGGELLETDASTVPLRLGDTLLVAGGRSALNRLSEQAGDFIVVGEPGELREKPLSRRSPWVLGILLAMLALMTFGLVANVAAVLLAAVAMVAVGALGMDAAYRHINWESVVLIAAILPLATALEKTGGLELIVTGLLAGLDGAGPRLLLLVLFALTSLLSQLISNTATTVLVAPIAFGLALDLGLSPYPLLLTVAVAASTAFSTPVASPVNALIINPGSYRFGDFLRVGVLLQLLVLAVTVLVVPWLFPF
jgi:di/tricarboxylate transporter